MNSCEKKPITLEQIGGRTVFYCSFIFVDFLTLQIQKMRLFLSIDCIHSTKCPHDIWLLFAVFVAIFKNFIVSELHEFQRARFSFLEMFKRNWIFMSTILVTGKHSEELRREISLASYCWTVWWNWGVYQLLSCISPHFFKWFISCFQADD
jgi:hypothetical protein